MKVSMNMLREYVDIPLSNAEYEKQMILCGNGIEGIEDISGGMQKVVVGKVLTCDNVEGSDHLHLCTVDVGGESPLQIVCGAPNVQVGILVPVALDGAILPGGYKIKKGKLRGLVSEGMLCSATELKVELYPSIGDAGLLVFQEDYPLGSDVKPIFGIDDYAVDFEILANRPDCLSAIGLARETAAVLNKTFHAPDCTFVEAGGDINQEVKIRVEDATLCPRYCARVIKNVRLAPSPMWMRKYLHGAGLRSINNIVDITNYIMLEYGHPMHAFDLTKVEGAEIVVRHAHQGESLTTLDGVHRDLHTSDLVICDATHATGIAGVMGGEESEITDSTKTILFECASFDRTTVRLTSRAQGMRTESSGRFERGVSPKTVMQALDRACALVHALDAGDIVSGVIDLYPNPVQTPPITASVEKIQIRAGVCISAEDMVDILTKLHFEVALDGDCLTVTPPPFRDDVEGEADICEEVLRLYGYHHIPATPLRGETTQGGINSMMRMKRSTAHILHGLGYLEIMNYSFLGLKELEKLGLNDWRMAPMAIRNPLGEDTAVMRSTLCCDMLKTLAFNMNHATEQSSLYEMAAIFNPHAKTAEGLPTETQTLCLGAYGNAVDFYTMRTTVEAILKAQGLQADIALGADAYYHPGRCATLTVQGLTIAQLGEVHPDVRERYDMPKRAVMAEVNLAVLLSLSSPMGEMKPLPRFPSVSRDLALVMPETVQVGPMMTAMKKAGGKLMESVSLFDVYRGAQIGEDNKSVAFAFVFRASDRTLTEPEIQKAMDKVMKVCAEQFQAVIRG